MRDESPQEREQAELAAREAAAIGGGDPAGAPQQALDTEQDGESDPALRPVYEAGGGESEGFEQAEELLIEHASHGDQQSAHAVLHDQGPEEEAIPGSAEGEPDREQSSEREDEESPSAQ
jgi:hypothetical protein